MNCGKSTTCVWPTSSTLYHELANDGERAFGDIADQFEMSRPAVSQHLKVLRDAGIVSVRPEAQRRIYSLSSNGLDEVDDWLRKVREFWNPRLDKLEQLLSEPD